MLSIDSQLLLMDNSRTYISQYFGTTDSVIVIPRTIKTIKLGAFRNRKSLEKIECDVECNVDVIEDFAFTGCTKFFSFPSFSTVTSIGESSFSGTSLNSSIAFSNSLSNIGTSCFSGCSLLQSVTLRSDVNVTIGNNAFDGCRSLTRFDLVITSDVYVVFGSSCFANCISLTYFNFISKILSFGDSCFINSGLRRVDFESSTIHMSSIPSFCFKDCVSLSDVSIPSNINIIGTESFSNTSINTVNLPDSVVLLSRECFKDCRQLVSFIISSNSMLEQIDYGVFSGCIRFKDISEFRSSHFCFENGAIFNTARDIMYVYPPASPNKFFAFPDKVRTIETSAFIGCVNIESVLIPDNSVVSIGDNAFEGCTSLRNINIPLCVRHIGTNAFKGCRSLICGVIYENKSSSFRSQLVSSGLSKQSLQQCYAKTCAVSMTTPVNRLFIFVFILM